MEGFEIVPMTPAHYPAVVALNKAWEHFTSPLSEEALAKLCDQACYKVVALADGEVAAFLIALREGQPYASPNYQWFGRHYQETADASGSSPAFLYIDRIVVGEACQGTGIGRAFYEDVFSVARGQHLDRVVCEVDAEPPNERSTRFHDNFGFAEIGRQWIYNDIKQVSLREKPL
ncbi:MAG: GNAT family N-acetyltransferase [Eggerthellaceae bacterium]|nr:GNAT family N-acetyltransferase [Eggerthellaceae bacterium]